jgi:hypothetical protein
MAKDNGVRDVRDVTPCSDRSLPDPQLLGVARQDKPATPTNKHPHEEGRDFFCSICYGYPNRAGEFDDLGPDSYF